jgi:tetratricopeptide (TPR) repeat protein
MLANAASATRKGRAPDRAPLVAALLVFLLTVAVYAPAWNGEFLIWDDGHNVFENSHIQGLTGDNLAWIARGIGVDSRFKPLGWLTYALIHEAFGLSAPAYHRFSILLHGANALLVLAFLFRLLTLAEGWKSRRVLNAATIGALFWSLHPLRVEGVAWISCLSFSVAMFFLTLSLLAFLHIDRARPWRGQKHYWLSLAAYLASMLSFPVVITAFVLPAALAIYPLKLVRWSTWRELAFRNGGLAARLSPYFVLSVVSGVLSMGGLLGQSKESEFMRVAKLTDFPFSERVMQSVWMEVYYLVHQVWPFPLRPVNVVAEGFVTWSVLSIGSALVIVVVSVALWRIRQARPWALAAWLAHLGVLVPCLGFMSKPFQPGDRYLIVSGAILAALLGGALARRVSAQQESLRLAISALALLALGATSYAYVPVWSDNLTNFTAQAETLPNGQRRTMALTRLGRVQFERNDIAGAIASFAAATASDPEYPDIELPWNYASALVAMKLLPEAAEQYARCLRLDPGFESAWHQYGALLFHLGERARGEEVFQQGMRVHAGSEAMIGAYANALMAAGDARSTLSMLQFQERLYPDNPNIRTMREQTEALLRDSARP